MDHSISLQYKNILVRPLSHKDIEYMRIWRNDVRNTKYLRKLPFITGEKQESWFESYLRDVSELGFAIEETQDLNRIVGSAFIYNISDTQLEFGKILIGDNEAHGKGIGISCTIAITYLAFKRYAINSVILHCYRDNLAALKVYKKVGFEITNEYENDGKVEYTMMLTRDRFFQLHDEFLHINGEDSVSTIEQVKLIEFPHYGDERGHLVIIEGEKNIPFAVKRVFYIYGSTRDVVRGKHANRKSEFILINVAGTSRVRVNDGKGNEKVFSLNDPDVGIYIPRMIWKDMYDFSSDSVLLCLSNEHYDAEEYIKDYDDYCRIVNEVK